MPKKPDTSGWQPPATAPLDGTMILADFGWPWAVPAVWDTYDEQWVTATVQASPMEDGPNNYWLETDTESRASLRQWHPIPSLPTPGKSPKSKVQNPN